MSKIVLALALLLAATGIGHAQQEIEWKQTLNIPKGQNISRDRADMLGIEFGDSYAEAKAKLDKLAAEGIQPPAKKPSLSDQIAAEGAGSRSPLNMRQDRKTFRFQAPGQGGIMTASYVGKITLERQLPGSGNGRIEETIIVHLTSPASGHQVVAMDRYISYGAADQPQVSDVLGQLQQKFKTEAQVAGSSSYRFQFDNGQGVSPQSGGRPNNCRTAIDALANLDTVRRVNETGDCDVVMVLDLTRGISQNHASALRFYFADNERIKANGTADYAFVDGYIRDLQSRTRGAPPKL